MMIIMLVATLSCFATAIPKQQESCPVIDNSLIEQLQERHVIEVFTDQNLEKALSQENFVEKLHEISPQGKDMVFIDPDGKKVLIQLSKLNYNCWWCCGAECPRRCNVGSGCTMCCN